MESLTDFRTAYADYSLTFDKYDGAQAGSIDKEPELLVRPIGDLFPHITWLPESSRPGRCWLTSSAATSPVR